MKQVDTAVRLWRKGVRRLNWMGFYIDLDHSPLPTAVLAGYTRSGTTFLGRVLSNILHARPIHEPLNPAAVPEISFFQERESRSIVQSDERYQLAIRSIFSKDFKGTRFTNTGTRLLYRGRVIKIVRGNHYLDYLSDLLGACPFVVIMRNPSACIASRLKQGWPVPDHSHSFHDLEPSLSAEQSKKYREGGSTVSRLAVSWCLDNVLLVRNAQYKNFLFLHYENLITKPESELERILLHIGRKDCIDRIPGELRLESESEGNSTYLKKWKGHFNVDELEEISEVLRIFNMSNFYDMETGLPLNNPPFVD